MVVNVLHKNCPGIPAFPAPLSLLGEGLGVRAKLA